MCLTLSQVTKRYDDHTVLDAVGFDVAAGERVALLGHNGAGKSTLMKIILGLVTADGGTVSVHGLAPGSYRARMQTAYLAENASFHPSLTGQEQLRYYLRLRGEDPRKAASLLERVGLGAAANRRIGTYSKGMRQRVGMAQALIGEPKLLILDEPTSGLDPVSRREFYVILDELAVQGTAILLSSHALTEVEARTDRIVILSSGVMVANDTLANLRQQASLPIRLQVSAQRGKADEVAQKLSGERSNGVMVDLVCSSQEKLARLGDISALGPLVDDVDVIPPSLEDIYSHFSKRGNA
ncbi:ABC transporter ATP-binding protein [Thalassospira xiamenensis]|jgi:Cu-processing system ATP-binding protein|uniref:ABC transporter ATP-binding protein n=1 Tax=Thalassospira xiamenensis TaxID=220697 RepID=UPI000E8C7EBA|nr:ABC transporter ATP-binding protein [Thalassospira xiamenensis]HBN50618.1 ABC transporter ATP-binding protein [Thalassospira sp.]|tara:strand:+ start:3537 stop:4427 length:891 start_codon:yes stop_codon:yes gene_type:complete